MMMSTIFLGTRLCDTYLLFFFQWAQQHNCLGLELPDQLPDISPGGLQWRLGSYKATALGVAL